MPTGASWPSGTIEGVLCRGQIEVDGSFRTALSHVYAVGDVAGPPGLASASYDQGRFVGMHIAEGECDWRLIKDFPSGIYTIPEFLEYRYNGAARTIMAEQSVGGASASRLCTVGFPR